MATANSFPTAIDYVTRGQINWTTDTFGLALTNTSPTSADEVIADITEIAYTNLSSRTVSIAISGETTGTVTATATKLVLTASGAVGPFRYVVLFDDTVSGDPLIAWWDYGSSITLANGDTFDFGTAATFPVYVYSPA